MDAAKNNNEEDPISFDLFNGQFEIFPINNEEGLEIGIPSNICELLDSVNTGESIENDDSLKAFEKTPDKLRFKPVTEQELDALQDENNAQSTHWQTNWAVKVMRGTIYLPNNVNSVIKLT